MNCRKLQAEVERLRTMAVRAGIYTDFSAGANPQYDVDKEAARWLATRPRATPDAAWRAGWSRAWDLAALSIRDWEARWQRQSTEMSSLRSKIGVLLGEISRLTDRG